MWTVTLIAGAVILVLNLLLKALDSGISSSGYRTDTTHECRYIGKGGQAGGRYGPATLQDVYDRRRGCGSWDKHTRNVHNFALFVTIGSCLLAPCVTAYVIDTNHLAGFGALVVTFILVLSFSVITSFFFWR
jgi:hypothetical protein